MAFQQTPTTRQAFLPTIGNGQKCLGGRGFSLWALQSFLRARVAISGTHTSSNISNDSPQAPKSLASEIAISAKRSDLHGPPKESEKRQTKLKDPPHIWARMACIRLNLGPLPELIRIEVTSPWSYGSSRAFLACAQGPSRVSERHDYCHYWPSRQSHLQKDQQRHLFGDRQCKIARKAFVRLCSP